MWWTNVFRLISLGHDWASATELLIERRTYLKTLDFDFWTGER